METPTKVCRGIDISVFDKTGITKHIKHKHITIHMVYDASWEVPEEFEADILINKCEKSKDLNIVGWYTSLSTARRLRTYWSKRIKPFKVMRMIFPVRWIAVDLADKGV